MPFRLSKVRLALFKKSKLLLGFEEVVLKMQILEYGGKLKLLFRFKHWLATNW